MAGFKQPDFIERQEAAAKARKLSWKSFAPRSLIGRWQNG
jgi:hypothetical protein